MYRFVIAQKEARVFLGLDKPHRGRLRERTVGNVQMTTASDAESMFALAQKAKGS